MRHSIRYLIVRGLADVCALSMWLDRKWDTRAWTVDGCRTDRRHQLNAHLAGKLHVVELD